MEDLEQTERLLELARERIARYRDVVNQVFNEFGTPYCPNCARVLVNTDIPHTCRWECGICGTKWHEKARYYDHVRRCINNFK